MAFTTELHFQMASSEGADQRDADVEFVGSVKVVNMTSEDQLKVCLLSTWVCSSGSSKKLGEVYPHRHSSGAE